MRSCDAADVCDGDGAVDVSGDAAAGVSCGTAGMADMAAAPNGRSNDRSPRGP
ncbi:hypothetical protein [Streptomyces sp. NPDC004232]|uniref:hypothetical protein n=1 Tax=unclassified Streptomyces TaxID=2593676 RepID=UPI001E17FE13|nr:hypothetical protein [Streptomyces sp. tea 10]